MDDDDIEPGWHVLRQVFENGLCVYGEVLSSFEGLGRVSHEMASDEARKLQEEHDAQAPDGADVVKFSVGGW